MIDSWNSAYFLQRHVEVVLVKGRKRYSGPTAGRVDPRLLRAVEDAQDDDSSDSSTSDDMDEEEFEREQQRLGYGVGGHGYYGGMGSNFSGNNRWMTDTATARREMRERRREKRKHRERRKRRSEDKKNRRYSLYVMSIL